MEITSFYDDLEYHEERPAIKQILETPFSKEIRILMKSGQVMKEHKAPAPIIIQILKGAIEFGLNNEMSSMKAGDIISLEANIPHSLSAKEDTMIRLSLLKTDQLERTEKVAN